MKPAVIALRGLVGRFLAGVGLEGALLLVGTALLAIGAAYLNPAGPWFVAGSVAVLLGLALAIPPRRNS